MLLAANARHVFLYTYQARQHFHKAIYPGFRHVRKIRLLFGHVWNNRLKKNTVIIGFGSRFSCPFVKEILCIEVNLLTVDCLLAAACYKKNCSGNSQVSLHNFIEKML